MPKTTKTAPAAASAARALDLRIISSLRRIIQAVDIHSRKLAARYDITTPQLVTLLVVADAGPLISSDIARRVHLSDSTVVGILDRLESKGLVVRERGTSDRRRVYVSITERGRALAESAPSPLQDSFAAGLGSLPELEQTAIALSLERIVELMEAKDIDASPVLTPGAMHDTAETYRRKS
ncbi:MAG: MarR family transcriptional regulator [Candidatus Hydrogenedens sp.]|nr:MarR family transcriptional regulator [Candidatus Hydrogenedens sp.]